MTVSFSGEDGFVIAETFDIAEVIRSSWCADRTRSVCGLLPMTQKADTNTLMVQCTNSLGR